MNSKRITVIIASLGFVTTMWAQSREIVCLNSGWEFSRDSLFSESKMTDIPHDFQIEQPWVPPTADEKADNSDVDHPRCFNEGTSDTDRL